MDFILYSILDYSGYLEGDLRAEQGHGDYGHLHLLSGLQAHGSAGVLTEEWDLGLIKYVLVRYPRTPPH